MTPARRTVPLLLALLAILAVDSRPAQAQRGPREVAESLRSGSAQVDASPRRWWNVWTEPSRQDRIIWGMWTTHLNRDKDGWQNDETLGVVARGYYAASFTTTHGPRAWTVGVERTWIRGAAGPAVGMLGWRGGLVYGYDRRLGWVAEKYPILPFMQPVIYGRLGPITADLTYTWVVVSITAGLRF